jgi:hypothetical protein
VSTYEIGPRRVVRIKYLFSPNAIAEVVYIRDGSWVHVWENYFGDRLEYDAHIKYCMVIPVVRAHSMGGDGWLWYVKVPGLLADGMHASADEGYPTKVQALMAGMEKYPESVVDDSTAEGHYDEFKRMRGW